MVLEATSVQSGLAGDLPFVSSPVGGSRSPGKPVREGWIRGAEADPQPRAGCLPVLTLELAEAGGDCPQQAPTPLASSLLSYRVCRWLPRLHPGAWTANHSLSRAPAPDLPCLEGETEACRLPWFYFSSSSQYPPITRNTSTIFDLPSWFSAS